MPQVLNACRLALFVAVASGLVFPSAVRGQVETGSLAGTVIDDTGGALPGVTVTVTNLATSQVRVAVTDALGRYQLPGLSPSQYSVKAELEGFETILRPAVTINLGTVVDLDFTMKVAALAETVTVTGEAPLIQSAQTQVSNVITTKQLETLPSKSRQYMDFVLLLPASVENTSTTSQGSGVNIGGSRAKEAALLVDGFYNMDEGFGLPRQRHSQDSIQEFQVVSFGGSAEHGRAIGGIINAITKSGANTFGGSAYGYFRGKALNAQDPGEKLRGTPKSKFDRQQWGGTLGGPLVPERTFFFGAYERVSENYAFDNRVDASNAEAIGLPPEDVGSLPRYYRLNFAMGKLDHNLSDSQRLQFNFAMSRWTEFDINTQTAFGARSQQQRLAATDLSYIVKWTAVTNDNHVFHELKGSYFPRDYVIGGVSLGGPPLTADGQVNQGLLSNSSPPRVTIPSVAIFGSMNINAENFTWPVQVIYSSTISAGAHTLKFGGDYMISKLEQNNYSPLKGAYSFSSLGNYLAGRYSTFSESFGNPSLVRTHHYISAFGQDSWRLSNAMTLNYGVRYDVEVQPKDPSTGQRLGKDYNNIFPRVGLSYDLSGRGTTVLKLSSGLYADRLYQRLSAWYGSLKDHLQIVSGTWSATSPGAPVYPAVFASQPDNMPSSVVNAWVFPDKLQTPTSAQVVGIVEHALSPSLAVSASAVYTRSWNKEYRWDTNLVWDDARQAWTRPDANYRQLVQYRFDGKAEYVGGILEVTQRGTRAGFTGNVTFARSYDSLNTGDNFPNDQREGVEADWGPSVDTPKVRGVVSGWYSVTPTLQVSGVFRARSGMAVGAIAAGLDLNGDQRFGDRTPTFKRNTFRSPGTNSVDLRVTWAPTIGLSKTLSLYFEAFNLFNRVNVRTVNNDYGPTPDSPKAVWMEPLTYFPPREMQLGARFTF